MPRVGDGDQGHSWTLLEHVTLLVGETDVVVVAEYDPGPHA